MHHLLVKDLCFFNVDFVLGSSKLYAKNINAGKEYLNKQILYRNTVVLHESSRT